jgi:pyruvate/2-oxoglutarate dehydrogenase complex dihydrolipoamide acyltransferase (E2) component
MNVLKLVAVIALAMLTLLAGCRDKTDDGTIHLNGRIEAPTVDLGPKVPGRVVEVLVREGDRVKAGALLVRLDLGETSIAVEREQAGVRSAEARAQDLASGTRDTEIAAADAEIADRRAAVSLAEKETERQRFLLDRKVGTQRDYDRARTDLERTRAALKVSQERAKGLREGCARAADAGRAGRSRARAGGSQAVGGGGARKRDPRAGGWRNRASPRRGGTARRRRAAGGHDGFRESSVRAHVHPGDEARTREDGHASARHRRRIPRTPVPRPHHRDLARRRVHAEGGGDEEPSA